MNDLFLFSQTSTKEIDLMSSTEKTFQQPQPQSELDSLAFEIFSKRVAMGQGAGKQGGERIAERSFREAETFLAVRARVHAGDIDLKPASAKGAIMADCCAPNLPRTHPHNLVSARLGDLTKVKRILSWLRANPLSDRDNPAADQERCESLNRSFPELNWNTVSMHVAEAIFPAYVAA
jgi:hypothetical protein